MFTSGGAQLAVLDTVKQAGDLHVHLGRLRRVFRQGDAVELRVDGVRRRRLRANHSVTHLFIRRCGVGSAPMSRKRARSSPPTGCASISVIRKR